METGLTGRYSTTFRRFAELFGVRRERANIPRLAEAAVKEGFAVIAVKPGEKQPICTLTPRDRKKADEEAKEAAKAAGKTRWADASHECGRAHAITEPAEARKVFTRLAKQGEVNLGAHPGKSGWIAVDADQAADVEAWMEHWARMSGDPSLVGAAPTVSSPGVFKGEEWRHRGGGHVWMWLPPEVNFANCDINTPLAYQGSQVYFADALILLPPSTRPEGEYVLQSDACQAPDWLVDALLDHVAEHTEKAARYTSRAYDGDSPIDKWALDQSWDELLSSDGWRFTHKSDRCSCPIWTRPGDDAGSYKSATAHEAGCLRFGDDEDFPGFLHVWSDNPPGFLQDYVRSTGRKSISKFNYVAWRDHAGDTKEAYRSLDLGEDSGPNYFLPKPAEDDEQEPDYEAPERPAVTEGPPGELNEIIRGLVAMEPAQFREKVGHEVERARAAARAREIIREAELLQAQKSGVEELEDIVMKMTTAFATEWEDEEWLVEGLLGRAGKSLFTAPAKAGKTTTMGSLVYALTQGEHFLGQFRVEKPQRVTIIDTEMTPRKHVEWLKSAGVNPELVNAFYLRGKAHSVDIRSEAAQVRWAKVLRNIGTDVLIIDPLSPILAGLGLDENTSGDVQAYLAGVDALITQADLAGAIVVHHHGHSGERGRGSSAFLGWPDAIWTLVKDDNDVRYFAALGRDIEIPESALEYDSDTRRVNVPQVGARRESKGDQQKSMTDSEVLAVIRGNPASTASEIAKLMGKALATVQRATERLELTGKIAHTEGPRNSKLWRVI